MTKQEQSFIRELESISSSLAVWAQNCIQNGWSVEDVKVHLRAVAKLCGRD